MQLWHTTGYGCRFLHSWWYYILWGKICEICNLFMDFLCALYYLFLEAPTFLESISGKNTFLDGRYLQQSFTYDYRMCFNVCGPYVNPNPYVAWTYGTPLVLKSYWSRIEVVCVLVCVPASNIVDCIKTSSKMGFYVLVSFTRLFSCWHECWPPK